MNRDFAWLALVMVLSASLLVTLLPEDDTVSVNEDIAEEALKQNHLKILSQDDFAR